MTINELQDRLKELILKKGRIRYRIKKIERLTDDEVKSKDIKDLQSLNRQLERVKLQISKTREAIRKKQTSSAYATVVRRSKLTSISRSELLHRNWYNTDWLDGREHLTKMKDVHDWQERHPGCPKVQCERELHMSHHTVDKWWVDAA